MQVNPQRHLDGGRRPAFDPECPVCRRQQLDGVRPAELAPRRTVTLLASGALALSAACPIAVLAAEPDRKHEGTTAAEQVTGGDSAQSPDFDPGGEPTELPFEATPVPQAQAPDADDNDAGPLEQEPTSDIVEPVADQGDEPVATKPEPQAAAPAVQPPPIAAPSPTPPPAQSEAAAPATQPTPAAPPATVAPVTPPVPAATPDVAPAAAERTVRGLRPVASKKSPKVKTAKTPPRPRKTRRAGRSPAVSARPVAAGAAAVTSEAAQAPSAPATAGTADPDRDRARPGDGAHVVRAGESLRAIASDLLGPNASAARIAREVTRLWKLNKDRIGTGNPNLLPIGAKLRLRSRDSHRG